MVTPGLKVLKPLTYYEASGPGQWERALSDQIHVIQKTTLKKLYYILKLNQINFMSQLNLNLTLKI